MIEITEDIARVILGMEEVCLSEGIGPDASGLLESIAEEYPHLVKEFEWVFKF